MSHVPSTPKVLHAPFNDFGMNQFRHCTYTYTFGLSGINFLGEMKLSECNHDFSCIQIQDTGVSHHTLAIALTPFNCFGIDFQDIMLILTRFNVLNYEGSNFDMQGRDNLSAACPSRVNFA